jgi:acetyltransferase
VEVLKDRALGLPPLNATLAKRLMEQTKIFKALKGVRGRKPVDLDQLAQIMVRFSQLVIEQPRVKEIEINPLIATAERIIAVDARTVLWPAKTPDAQLPRPSIRPYPTQYASTWSLNDGMQISIRPIRPEDEPLLVQFHEGLSDRSVMFRYFHPIHLSERVAHERLIRVCFNDYDRELALVAEARRPDNGERFILGIGRFRKLPGNKDAEFAIVISDKWQKKGLGTQLLNLLVDVARKEKLEKLSGMIMPENLEMRHIAEKIGFKLTRDTEDTAVRAVLEL